MTPISPPYREAMGRGTASQRLVGEGKCDAATMQGLISTY